MRKFLNTENVTFAIKAGLAAGAVYFVSEQGVWRNSEETTKLCNKISTNLSPYTQEISKQLPFELPSLPPRTEVSYMAKYYWNCAVKTSFAFIANVPTYVGNFSNKGITAVMDSTDLKNLFVSTADAAERKE